MSGRWTGVSVSDPRWAAVRARRAEARHGRDLGQMPWERTPPGALQGSARLGALDFLLGAGLVVTLGLPLPGPLALPTGEVIALLLVMLAFIRRPRRDASVLGAAALVAVPVLLFLAVTSLYNGIGDFDWIRRLVRIAALTLLVGACASERVEVRALIWGSAVALAVNVPLFYLGLVPAPYGDYLTGLVDDKNVSGFFYAAVPILVVATLRSPRAKAAILSVGAVPLFLTGSRTSMAAYACATVWMLVTPRFGWFARLLVLGAMAWVVSFAEENLARIGIFADRDGTDWLRSNIHEATQAKVAETPWYGQGLTEALVTIDRQRWFFHDSYAGLWVEGGVVMAAAVLSAYLVFGLRLFNTQVRTPSRIAVEASTVVVLVAAQQLGEVFISITGMLVLAAGAVLYVEEKRAPEAKAVELRHRDRVVHAAEQRFERSQR